MAEKQTPKYEEDKVYLRAPHGTIWPYDPALAKVQGYTAVVPNKSKKPVVAETEEKTETPKGTKPETK